MTFAASLIERGGNALLTLYAVLPVLAVFLGLTAKAKWFKVALIGTAALSLIYLVLFTVIIEKQLYQRATGMEGLALFILPALLALSTSISTLCYVAARAFARLP